MEIRWFGHSFFLITNSREIRVAMDPFDETLGYKVLKPRAEVVTVSHNHFDHDAPRMVKGLHPVLKGAVNRDIHKIHFKGIKTYHDRKKGKLRGENTVFIVETDGLKIVHLGDLGHIPSEEIIKELKGTDILFIPTGGVYTIEPDEAKVIVDAISPAITIPMHYFTPYIKLPLRGVEEFTKFFENVRYFNTNKVYVEKENMPKKGEVWVLRI